MKFTGTTWGTSGQRVQVEAYGQYLDPYCRPNTMYKPVYTCHDPEKQIVQVTIKAPLKAQKFLDENQGKLIRFTVDPVYYKYKGKQGQNLVLREFELI